MKKTFGADCGAWPNVGRGGKFFPFKSGPSTVAGLKDYRSYSTTPSRSDIARSSTRPGRER
eukprot:2432305-Pyramimonas_sp.AAC.1